jgi:hypothetical protein
MRPRYYVRTWDAELQEFTPQEGVSEGPHTLWGLKHALRELRELGYECRGGDPNVFVFREGGVQIPTAS